MGALAGLLAVCAAGQTSARVIFLEPVQVVDTRGGDRR
jgi:hypothetical protein